MAGAVAEATKETFRDLVAEGTTLVDVWGTECQPCMALMPFVERLAEERAGEVKVVKLEAPKARRLCIEMRVMGLPAFLLFQDGEEVARINGADLNESKIQSWLDETLGAAAGAGKE